MIIPCFAFKSLEDYQENFNSTVLDRPNRCALCEGTNTFWKHGTFKRFVFDKGTKVELKVQRFLCSSCGKTASLLYSFLVAYSRHSASAMADSIESYSTAETTYRAIADQQSPLDTPEDSTPSPSHSTVFRWTAGMAARGAFVSFQIQKELVLRGRSPEIAELEDGFCPNSPKARSASKQNELDALADCIQLGRLLVDAEAKAVVALHAFFQKNVETIQMILSNRLIKLLPPQNMRHAIF